VSLRVLGLAPSRTRIVSAVEAGAGAVVGGVLGLALFWLAQAFAPADELSAGA
jgi:hypothetical protein